MRPSVATIMPASTAVSSLWPLPSTPATPDDFTTIHREREVVETRDALIVPDREAVDLQSLDSRLLRPAHDRHA
jgi:hypothetical protein